MGSSKKILRPYLALILLASWAPAPASAKEFKIYPGPTGPVNDWELIGDREFAAGFDVIKNCQNPDKEPECAATPRVPIRNTAHPEYADAKPVWDLAEWGSKSSLAGAAGTRETGGVSWANEHKRLSIRPGGHLEFAVNGMNEYDGKYPADWEKRKWAHLLIGQTIAGAGLYSRPSGSLADMTKLNFSIDVHRVHEAQNKKEGYDPNRHAAFFPLSIVVQNLTRGHEGFGQYVWLQVVLYDDRQTSPGGLNAVDGGTGSLMYPVPYGDFGVESTHTGKWIHLEKDILPYARKGIQQAAAAGLIKSGNLGDYHIGAFNMGYELPGLNTSTFEFKNFSLKVNTSNLYTPGGIHTDPNSLTSKSAGNTAPEPASPPPSNSSGDASANGKPAPEPAEKPVSYERVEIHRSYNASLPDHLFTPDPAEGAPAYKHEGVAFSLYRDPAPGRVALYRCYVNGKGHFISGDPSCEGQHVDFRLGYADKDPTPQTKGSLFRCYSAEKDRHLITFSQQECTDNGYAIESSIGNGL